MSFSRHERLALCDTFVVRSRGEECWVVLGTSAAVKTINAVYFSLASPLFRPPLLFSSRLRCLSCLCLYSTAPCASPPFIYLSGCLCFWLLPSFLPRLHLCWSA
ncbi:unnamed protein product, partial [Sphacelaria rigidula]